MYRLVKSIILCIASSLVLAVAGLALAPNIVSYQGRLTDSGGNPVADGPYLVKFRIYDSDIGGTELWTSEFQSVDVVDGLFTYHLGSIEPLPASITADSVRWLGIQVSTDPEMTPRIRFTSSLFALNALKADSSDWDGLIGAPPDFADGVDDNTTYSAGSGLQLSGTTFLIPNGAITAPLILDNTITKIDILDEPGGHTASISGNLVVVTSAILTKIDSVTIDLPSAGAVWLVATGDLRCTHLNGQRDWFDIGISLDGSTVQSGSKTIWLVPATYPTSNTAIVPFAVNRFITGQASGPNTYYIMARKIDGGSQDLNVGNATITAIYLPSQY